MAILFCIIMKEIGIHELYARNPEASARQLWGREVDPHTRRGFLRSMGLAAMTGALLGFLRYNRKGRLRPSSVTPLQQADTEEEVTVELEQDSHLIVVAIGEGSNLRKGWGRSPVPIMPPVAFTNPIYVDVDGNGFQASGDTLGHPLLVAPEEPEP